MTRLRQPPSRSARGFTMIELVVAIVITAIVVGFATMFLSAPVDAYVAQSRRGRLVETADAVSRSMTQDLARALPNSVRIRNAGTRAIVEMLRVESVAFYSSSGAVPARELDFAAVDAQFATLGRFNPSLTRGYLSVTNTTNPYVVANRAVSTLTNIATVPSGLSEDLLTLGTGFRFGSESPTKRIFLVSTPVTYLCDSAATVRTLRRFSGYAYAATIPTAATSAQLTTAGAVNTLVAQDVLSCALRCRLITNGQCLTELTIDLSTGQTTASGTEQIRVFAEVPMETRT
jgi:MSHA biogenesis protein MshO